MTPGAVSQRRGSRIPQRPSGPAAQRPSDRYIGRQVWLCAPGHDVVAAFSINKQVYGPLAAAPATRVCALRSALLGVLVLPCCLSATGREQDSLAASWRAESSAQAALPRLVYMQAFPMVQGKDSGGVRAWPPEDEPRPWNAWKHDPERMPVRVGTGEFLYGTTNERPVLLYARMRMCPLPPAEDEGPATLDGVAGPVYRRLHIGDSLASAGYRAWLCHAPLWHETAGQARWAGAAYERPCALIPPVQDGASRAALSLPGGRARRGGDGPRVQAALSAGVVEPGSAYSPRTMEPNLVVLPNPALRHARVPGNGLFTHGVALSRAGHVNPYRGKRLRCTPAGG